MMVVYKKHLNKIYHWSMIVLATKIISKSLVPLTRILYESEL